MREKLLVRPLVDFVHINDVAWQDMQIPGTNKPVRSKLLSTDPDTGGMSTLIEFPPGWERTEEGFYDQDEEVFYLGGAVDAGDVRYKRYSYQFRPVGQRRGRARSETGALALAFFDARPIFTPSPVHGPMYRPEREIAHLNLAQMEWERPRTAGFPAGAARKTLRWDEENGSGFWIIGLLPHWLSPFKETHTTEEENYILEGEITTTIGKMAAGAYLAHPAQAVHGPMHSLRGALAITRAKLPYETSYTRVEGYTFPIED